MNQCGQVSPRWIRLRDIQWVGHTKPDPHFMIVYERCLARAEDGSHLCREHRPRKLATYSYSNVRVFIDGVEMKDTTGTVDVEERRAPVVTYATGWSWSAEAVAA